MKFEEKKIEKIRKKETLRSMFTCTVYTLSIEKHNFISVCRFISSVNFSAMFKLVKKIDKCFRFSNELKCCLSARNILCTLAYIRPEPCIPFRWKFLAQKVDRRSSWWCNEKRKSTTFTECSKAKNNVVVQIEIAFDCGGVQKDKLYLMRSKSMRKRDYTTFHSHTFKAMFVTKSCIFVS